MATFYIALISPFRSRPVLYGLLFVVPYLFLIIYTFQETLKVKIITYLAIIIIEPPISYILLRFFDFSFHHAYADAPSGDSVTCIVLCISTLIHLIFSMSVCVFWKVFVNRLRRKEFLLYILLPTYQLILLAIFLRSYSTATLTAARMGTIILTFGIIIHWIMVYSINNMIKKAEIEEQLAALYAQRQLEWDYYKMAQVHMDEMQVTKHDFTDHLQIAYACLEQNSSKKEVKKILDSTKDNLNKHVMMRYCENEIVNAVLTMKKTSAVHLDIPMSITIRIQKQISIETIDLCSLFCNLLDNAIEACQRISSGNKHISVKADTPPGFLVIKVENTAESKFFLHGLPSKTTKDSFGHGYGLKLIEQIVHKYNGNTEISYQDGLFVIVVSLET